MPHPQIDGANGRRQTGAAVGENQLQGSAFQSAPVQISQQLLPVRRTFPLAAQKGQQVPAPVLANAVGDQHLHLLASRRPPHPQTHPVDKQVNIVIAQPRLMNWRTASSRSRVSFDTVCALTVSPVIVATTLPTCRVEMPRKNASRISSDTSSAHAENAATPPPENFSPGCAPCAGGWSRIASRNLSRSSHCGIAAAALAAAHRAPSPNSDRAAVPIAARKTAARRASFAHTNRPQKLSFISARKCWICSVIRTIFAIGCRSPFQERLLLVRQKANLHPLAFYTLNFTSPARLGITSGYARHPVRANLADETPYFLFAEPQCAVSGPQLMPHRCQGPDANKPTSDAVANGSFIVAGRFSDVA